MVETIVFNLATKVVGKIGSVAIQNVELAWGVEEELKTLEGTLSNLKAALLDTERLYNRVPLADNNSNVLRVWFERLQDAFYEADNVLDEFQYEALRSQVFLMNQGSGVIQQRVCKLLSCLHTLAFRFKFKKGCKIEKIIKRLDRITNDRNQLQQIITENKARAAQLTEIDETEFVGRDNDRLRILQLLMTSSVDGENISVIPIVGIGGVGKTALVQVLYRHAMVVEHFEVRMWVRLEEDFNVKQVMQAISQSITCSPCDDLNANQLQIILQENLHGRRFFLVLDDVCNCDNRDWVKFFRLLIGAANGSKIVVTTRSKPVALIVGTVPMYNLEGLSDVDCHELLLKWAGEGKARQQDGNYSKWAMDIVKKCHGNPLAAKCLGNLLFMRTNENEWVYVRDRELWELGQDNRLDILPMLQFKYNPLPAYLKRCFIYCSIFPKNYEIEIDKLIQLWMAQGLIQSSGLNHELEDIGIDYLNQLCSIFFLEKIERHGNLSNTCRMPEIIHDLAIFMANEECLNTANYRSGSIYKKVKHVSFCDFDCLGEKMVTESLFKENNLQTVLFPFQGVGAGDKSFLHKCISRFTNLYVLDLSNSCFHMLPHSIGNLKHLRFFDLSGNANIETLPNAICKLYNLHTLRLWHCVKLQQLPKNIGNLISLRHLYLTTQQSCLSNKQIRRLTSLRSFRIARCGNLKSLPEGMQCLASLTTVTIAECPNLTSLPSTMKNLANLRNLEISNCPDLNLSEWEDFRGLRRIQ